MEADGDDDDEVDNTIDALIAPRGGDAETDGVAAAGGDASSGGGAGRGGANSAARPGRAADVAAEPPDPPPDPLPPPASKSGEQQPAVSPDGAQGRERVCALTPPG